MILREGITGLLFVDKKSLSKKQSFVSGPFREWLKGVCGTLRK